MLKQLPRVEKVKELKIDTKMDRTPKRALHLQILAMKDKEGK